MTPADLRILDEYRQGPPKEFYRLVRCLSAMHRQRYDDLGKPDGTLWRDPLCVLWRHIRPGDIERAAAQLALAKDTFGPHSLGQRKEHKANGVFNRRPATTANVSSVDVMEEIQAARDGG